MVIAAIVAVVLAYNANDGLPFIPTYDLEVQMPRAANLQQGDEVRIGGHRVGLIESLESARAGDRMIALARVKIDADAGPLSRDTAVRVRFASPVGLKFLELEPGNGPSKFSDGDTVPLANYESSVEYDEFLSLYDERTQRTTGEWVRGFGNALAGRGPDLNVALGSLPPLLRSLTTVSGALAEPETRLRRLFPELAESSRQLAPVARTQGRLFEHMTTTFRALNRFPEQLGEMVEKTAPTQEAGIESFAEQARFLEDFTDVTRDLRPVSTALRRTLPAINGALRDGIPGQRDGTRINDLTIPTLQALDDLAAQPTTLAALEDLEDLLRSANPLLAYVAPFQTVCNYFNYATALYADSASLDTGGGTGVLALLNAANSTQPNALADYPAFRPADVPASSDPRTATDPSGAPFNVLHNQLMAPAVDAAGNADCQAGQYGYPVGPLASGSRYPPSDAEDELGGSHVVLDPDTPGLAGTTFTGRPNVEAIP